MKLRKTLMVLIIAFCMISLFAGCTKKEQNEAVTTNDTVPFNEQKEINPEPNVEPTVTPDPTATPEPERVEVENPDFRKIKWGMSREEIKNIEGEPFDTGDEMIMYDDLNIAGKDVRLAYCFNQNDQAYKAVYFSVEEHTNLTDYVTDYNDFVSVLSEKYGSPKEDKTIWKADLYKDTPSDWGMAVAVGHLVKYATWETENTSINIDLNGDNYYLLTLITYKSTKIAEPVVDRTEGL